MDAAAFPLRGGLNLAGLTLALKPGECTLLENFIPLELGGYQRFAGYERYDGHPEPHKNNYWNIPFVGGSMDIPIGSTIVGESSGATAHVLAVQIDAGTTVGADAVGVIVVDRIAGTFLTVENLSVALVSACLTSGDPYVGTESDAKFDEWSELAAVSARELIHEVPGDGPVRGVAILNGVVYAVRNADGNASAVMHSATPGGWLAVKTGLAPNGTYTFIEHNFKGAATTRALYGVSGTHKAFEWNGTTWTDITTGMVTDIPLRIAEHKNYLWLGFANGSLQNSPVGDPTGTWTLRTGSAEFGIGDEITALQSTRGGVLAVYCERGVRLLYGSSTQDWDLKPQSDKSGAFPRSVQDSPIGPLSIDALGISPLVTSQNFGDFETATISQRVKPFLTIRDRVLVDSCALASGSQYRAFFDDGAVLVLVFNGQKIAGYSILRVPFEPTCVAVGVDASGKEMLVAGATDGFVYRLDVGNSMDGIAVDCVVRTAPDDRRKPRVVKHFQKAILHVQTQRPLRLFVQPELDYRLSPSDVAHAVAAQAVASSDLFDVGRFDEMVFDGGDYRTGISVPELDIDASGVTVSFLIYHGQEIRPPFTIESGILHSRDRGFAR